MTAEQNKCNCSSGCCSSSKQEIDNRDQVTIDFLYLDLNTCEPCSGTEKVLDEAVRDVEKALAATGLRINVNKIKVESEKQAEELKLISSPTIRINGIDMQLEVKESYCPSCSELSGEDVNCQVWSYKGQEYHVPPKAMIIEAILSGIFGSEKSCSCGEQYIMPENLKKFFRGINSNDNCCSCSDGCC
jgi:hypothetical protein